jgi:hypothetical protein
MAYYGNWPPTPVRPPAMDRAVWLLRLGAALTVLGGVVNLLLTDTSGSVTDSGFGRSNNALDDSTVEAVAYVSAAITTGVIVSLWLWMAWANGRGKTWARTVATVLGCIYGGFWLIGVAALAILPTDFAGQRLGARLIGSALSLATLLVGIGALWLMYRPESDAFYAAGSAPRYLPPYPPYPPYSPYPPYPPYPPSYGYPQPPSHQPEP